MKIKEEKLRQALNSFVEEMTKRLAEKEDAGYTGWDKTENGEHIFGGIVEDVNELDVEYLNGDKTQSKYIDIANRAMMLWYQVESEEIQNDKT